MKLFVLRYWNLRAAIVSLCWSNSGVRTSRGHCNKRGTILEARRIKCKTTDSPARSQCLAPATPDGEVSIPQQVASEVADYFSQWRTPRWIAIATLIYCKALLPSLTHFDTFTILD
jgi:hypothetical protein